MIHLSYKNGDQCSIYQHVATNGSGDSFASQHLSDSIVSEHYFEERFNCSPEPAIKCPMLQRKLICMWYLVNLRTIRLRSLAATCLRLDTS